MKNFLYLFFLLLLFSNCTLNKVINHHGVHNLKFKQSGFKLATTNKNDVTKEIGPPSTKSVFDTELWIYIERKTSTSRITKLGRADLLVNDVLLLEFDTRGILVSQNFYNKDSINKLKYVKNVTVFDHSKKSFVYEFFSAMRQKIDDPLGIKRTGAK
tara:strand:+ start:49 stop:519 length:471 start_codon:yes stop_codon:yes gene_type:complete